MKIRLLPLLLVLAGCEPKFQGHGPLLLEGSAFTPVKCRVLAPRATGIELRDASGVTVALSLRPAIVDAWEEVSGAAEVELASPGAAPTVLGPCAKLSLKGEGYHADHKRAASGTATLDCPQVKGTLTFTGCF